MDAFFPWQTGLWQTLNGLRGRLPHALLLKGVQGIGKLSIATEFARSLLCEQPNALGTACGNCASCHWFAQDTHPDFRLIQPENLASDDEQAGEDGKKSKQISVDQIRKLVNFSNLTAHQGGMKVILIHPAEAMNVNAANALLKTLEEPPQGVLFILVSHKPQQLLPTILSRCLAITAVPPAKEDSLVWLVAQGVAKPELCLARAGNSPLLALELAETTGDGIEQNVLLAALVRPEHLDAMTLSEQLQRTEPGKVIQQMQQWCYDLLAVSLTEEVRYHTEQAEQLAKLGRQVDLFQLLQFQRELTEAKRVANHPLNPRLVFETLLFSYQKVFLKSIRHAVH